MEVLVRDLKLHWLFLLLAVSLGLSSCRDGKLAEQPSSESPVVFHVISVTDYTLHTLNVHADGNMVGTGHLGLDLLYFYNNSDCMGVPLGQMTVNAFRAQGIDLVLPREPVVDIYVSVQTQASCDLVVAYEPPVLEPAVPVLVDMFPASPSRETSSPLLSGTAFPLTSTIEFFSDIACMVTLATGSRSAFSSTGIVLALTPNTTTEIYARTRDNLGQYSLCTKLTEFKHSDALSDSPQLLSMTPLSPSNQIVSPTLRIQGGVDSEVIRVYKNPACSHLLVEGSPADFSTVGFQVELVANSTTSLYAQSFDEMNNPSVCVLLGQYTHDNVAPTDPTFSAADPVSPSNVTPLPRIKGFSSVDTTRLEFYDSHFCNNMIGMGTKAEFEGLGVAVGVKTNEETSIYAKAFDQANNGSGCLLLTQYMYNIIPPDPPSFLSSFPTSPNNSSTTPKLFGTVEPRTTNLVMYKDSECAVMIGSGTAEELVDPDLGIEVSVDDNAVTAIYVQASDLEGNVSECTFFATYDHSTVEAPTPGFYGTFPASPSNASATPSIIGTADSSIATVSLYSDTSCTSLLGSGTRGKFTASGVQVTLSSNSTTNIYGKAVDVYGNPSQCVFITQYIHNTVPPIDPTYTGTTPLSPNNQSYEPLIFGQALHNMASQLVPNRVVLYDSSMCSNNVGEGTPEEFSTTGILLNLPPNNVSNIYARSFDAAGNATDCTFLTDYTHNALIPGAPVFYSVTPEPPSYNNKILISGNFTFSHDFMNKVSMSVYTNSTCTDLLATGSPSAFMGSGFAVEVPENASTTLYGQTVNEVGTLSSCAELITYVHYDQAPQVMGAFNNTDGSVSFQWIPDTTSRPTPTYTVERSLYADGPFTIVATGLLSNLYRDINVSDNTTYYYRVFASNNTGRSQNSDVASVTTSAPPPLQAANLTAHATSGNVRLAWSGFPQNMVYKIGRSSQYAGPFVDLGVSITTTTYTDYGLTDGQTYYYIVTAQNPSGMSVQSNVASAVPRQIPDAPLNFSLVPKHIDSCSGGGVEMSWTAPSYYEKFNIYSSENNPATAIVVASTTDTKAVRCYNNYDNRIYYFTVTSAWGDDISGPAEFVGVYPTSSPVSLNVEGGDNKIIMSWNTLSKPTKLNPYTTYYDLYRSDRYDGDYIKIASGLTSNSYSDAVPNGSGAYYYLQAYVTEIVEGQPIKVFIGHNSDIKSATAAADPSGPVNLTLTTSETGDVLLSWTPPHYYNGFNLYRATNPSGPFTKLSGTYTNAYVQNPAAVSGTNYYKVTARWGDTESAESNVVMYRNSPILGLGLTAYDDRLELSWNSIGSASDYIVYRSENANSGFIAVATTTLPSYTDSSIDPNKGYYYRVAARFNFDNNDMGARSAVVSGLSSSAKVPSNVSLSLVSSTTVRAEWPRVADAKNYTLYSATNAAGPYTLRQITSATSANVSGFTPATEVFIKVAANIDENLYESAAVSIWTYQAPSQAPAAIQGDGQIELNWSLPVGATSVKIQRSTDGVSFTTLVAGYVSPSFVDTTVSNGQIYFYRLEVDYGGLEMLTPMTAGVTPGLTPLAPSNLVVENNSTGTEAVLSWIGTRGGNRYNVYVSTSSGSYSSIQLTTSSTSGVTVSGLTANTNYYFIVKAVNGSVESAASNEATLYVQAQPSKPLAVADPLANSIAVTWPSVPSAIGYAIWRSDNGVDFYVLESNHSSTSYTDNSIDPLQTYYYKYQGIRSSGIKMAQSAVSDAVSTGSAPLKPEGFFAQALTLSSVHLQWIIVPNVVGYKVWRSTNLSGPFSEIAQVSGFIDTYVDGTVTASQTYYYKITAINSSGVSSLYSDLATVTVVAPAFNLVATNVATGVNLSWNPVVGATTYNVLRSEVSGGPYGPIGSVTADHFDDDNVESSKTYFYVVEAIITGAGNTIVSNEASIVTSGHIKLQVPIEMLDIALASSGLEDLVFARSQVSFDSSDYDGVESYEFEIIASNFDTVPHAVSIIDSSDNIVGSIMVPANQNQAIRLKTAVILHSGRDVYRLLLPRTTYSSDLNVFVARILVNQVNATKTKLYYPLLALDGNSTEDTLQSAYTTSSTSYSEYDQALWFQRQAQSLYKIEDYNAWELEALVATQGTSQGLLGFQNINTNVLLPMTETRFVSPDIVMASIPFNEGTTYFGVPNENQFYRAVIRCELNCDDGSVSLYKAGLWVKLKNLKKAQSIFRMNSYAEGISTPVSLTQERVFLDLDSFTSPQVYFHTLARTESLGDQSDTSLLVSTDDFGADNISMVSGSTLTINSQVTQMRVSPALTLGAQGRYMTGFTPSSGVTKFRSSFLKVNVNP